MKKIILLIILILQPLYAGCKSTTYIPDKAKKLFTTVEQVNEDVLPNRFAPWYFSSLIEHESCVQLCGKGYWARRCWSPKSRLKTYWNKDKTIPREEGAGLLQLTRAWNKTGRLRFDTIMNLKRKYPKELHELTWKNVYKRPDLQLKAGLLLWRDNDDYLNKDITGYNRLWFLDSIYNGGSKWLLRERTKCKLKQGCNPRIWFNNVADINCRGHRKLYGNRTAWDINRHHVVDVKRRMDKYKKLYIDSQLKILELNNSDIILNNKK